MENEWVAYPMFTSPEGAEPDVWVNVNLAAREGAPHSALPLLTTANLSLKKPDALGLAADDERDAIAEGEVRLQDAIASFGGAHVLNVQMQRQFKVHAYSGPGEQARVHAAFRAAFKGWKIEIDSSADPEWDVYLNHFPDAELMIEIENGERIGELEALGDDLNLPRNIDHFASFPSVEAAKRFCDAVLELDFTTARREVQGENETLVISSREDPVHMDAISALTQLLSSLALAEGGAYTGWDASPAKSQ